MQVANKTPYVPNFAATDALSFYSQARRRLPSWSSLLCNRIGPRNAYQIGKHYAATTRAIHYGSAGTSRSKILASSTCASSITSAASTGRVRGAYVYLL